MLMLKMFTSVTCLLELAAASVLLAACGAESPPLSAGVSRIVLDDGQTFEGQAWFHENEQTLEPGHAKIVIIARAFAPGERQDLTLAFFGPRFPGVGTFAIVPTPRVDGSTGYWHVTYSRTSSGFHAFDAASGSVEILRSQSGRIDLVMRMRARQYCLMLPDGSVNGLCDPAESQRSAKSISVLGRISALRAKSFSER